MRVISSIGFQLRQVQQAQSRALDFQQSYDLTWPQMALLGAVVSNPGIDQRTVSAVTFVDKSTVADVTTRLVERGLLRVSRNEFDGRRDRLVATVAAITVVYEATPTLMGGNDAVLGTLTPTERDAFVGFLETIGHAGREEPPSKYTVPSPDGARPPLTVTWGLGRPLRACLQRYNRLWNEHIQEVTALQWLALSALTEDSEIDQRTLGRRISLDKATLTEMLNRLLRLNLIEKRPDTVDRRRRILEVTATGHNLVRSLTARLLDLEEAFLEPLNEQSQNVFSSALARVAKDCDPDVARQGRAPERQPKPKPTRPGAAPAVQRGRRTNPHDEANGD